MTSEDLNNKVRCESRQCALAQIWRDQRGYRHFNTDSVNLSRGLRVNQSDEKRKTRCELAQWQVPRSEVHLTNFFLG